MSVIKDLHDIDEIYIGTVKEIDTIERRVGVYIPKLMPGISEDQPTVQTPTNPGNIKAPPFYQDKVTVKQYIWVKMFDADSGMPEIGSHVGIYFIDDQITKGFCFKFNPNSDYSIIPEERYKKLFDLKIGDKSVEVYENDTISINIPDDLSVILVNNENKNIRLNIMKK